ncbi:MAG TPA: glycosyltransferase [Candidatus Binatia bacterium]|nr:glycosyltransferase [Candidatus Binatia bacterium]
MNKVLVISYHFPPTGGSKTRRMLKFLKYLSEFSWTPVVLTVRQGQIFSFDPSLLEQIPGDVRVYRTRAPLTANSATRSSSAHKKQDPAPRRGLWFWPSLSGKIFNLGKNWIAVPDRFVTWLPYAVFKGLSVIRNDNVSVIYSTAPPFSNHLVAALLKGCTQRPLVVDFRDAWIANPARERKYGRIRQAVESLLEKIVIKSADVVVTTTDGITADFRSRYASERPGKFITLPNGFDRDEFQDREASKRTLPNKNKMSIVHTGYLLMERSPKPFLQALRRLLDERPGLESEMETHFIGESNTFLDGKKLIDYIDEYDLHRVVKLTGHVSRGEATQHQTCADLLLLIIGTVPKEQVMTYGVASKVFDYMMAQKYVLAIADEGPVWELVKKTKIGEVLPPSNIEGIKQCLSRAYDLYTTDALSADADMAEVSRYDVHVLTSQLATLLSACVEGAPVHWETKTTAADRL